eukprot:2957915-Pleurochrysis_carterae.AAC.1
MNEVLRSYGQKWAFSEKKGRRDTRPSGNESRALLTFKGLLREMLYIRYGHAEEPAAAEALDEMTDVQNRIRHVDPEPPDRQAAVDKKRKVRML